MKNLSIKWQRLIIWITGYLNIIAFVLAGGYFYLKTDDEGVRYSAKTAFMITVIFTVLSALQGLFSNIFNMAGAYEAASVVSKVSYAIAILKTLVYAALCILDFCGIRFSQKQEEVKQEEVQEDETFEE